MTKNAALEYGRNSILTNAIARRTILTPLNKLIRLHRFSNDTDMPVAFTTVIVPGSTGFEYALRILYGLAADGETDKKGIPRNIITLAAVSAMSDMHPAGAGRLISPLFGLFNRIAKQSGITNKLIDRYCK